MRFQRSGASTCRPSDVMMFGSQLGCPSPTDLVTMQEQLKRRPARRTGLIAVVLLAAAGRAALGAGSEMSVVAEVSADHAALSVVACTGSVERDAPGRLRHCELANDTLLGGQPVPAGSRVTFDPDGLPGMVRLSRESPVYGQPLPAGTILHFTDGRLRHFWLPSDTVIQGHLVRAQDDGAGARLHPNGRLLAIWLARDETIDGVPCTSSGNILRMGMGVIRLGTMRMAWFRPNGRLQQCMLSRDVMLDGHALHQGSVVGLDPDGRVDVNAQKLFHW